MVGRDPHHMHRSVAGGLPRAAVFGVNDGLVSNVSLILGFAGGGAGASLVRLAGVAGAVAGAISMAAGEWVSITAQNDLIRRELDVERGELERHPMAETVELAGMYESHGMTPEQARRAAADVMRRPDEALVVHAREELGVDPEGLPSPGQAAVLSFVCFLVGALLPVVPWLWATGTAPTILSIAIGVAVAAAVGALIAGFAERSVVRSAARQVLIVLGACGVTYAIGQLLGVTVS